MTTNKTSSCFADAAPSSISLLPVSASLLLSVSPIRQWARSYRGVWQPSLHHISYEHVSTATSPSSSFARSFRNALCFHYCAALVLVSLTLLTNAAFALQLSPEHTAASLGPRHGQHSASLQYLPQEAKLQRCLASTHPHRQQRPLIQLLQSQGPVHQRGCIPPPH